MFSVPAKCRVPALIQARCLCSIPFNQSFIFVVLHFWKKRLWLSLGLPGSLYSASDRLPLLAGLENESKAVALQLIKSDLKLSVSFWIALLNFPESAEVTCEQPLCRTRSGLPRQLRLSAQRGPGSGHSSGQRQPDAHLQECWNHQRLNRPQPSTSLISFTLLLFNSCLLLRVTCTQILWTFKRTLS